MSTKTRGDLRARSLWHRGLPATPTTLAALALALTLGGCSFIVDGKSYGRGGSDAGSGTDSATPDGGATDGGATDGATPDGGVPDGGMTDGGTDGGSPDAPPSCTLPRMMCGDECVDTSSDPAHCGACGDGCDPGDVCIDSMCVQPCDCGPREFCVAGGACQTSGSCDTPLPTCTTGPSGEVPPVRLATISPTTSVDVHVAQNPNSGPGWVILMRIGTSDVNNLRWVYASAPGCYDVVGPNVLSRCDPSEPRTMQSVSDARTIWTPSPDLYLATSPEPAPAALWRVRDSASMPTPLLPSALCAEKRATWEGLDRILDLSITPGLPPDDDPPPVAAAVVTEPDRSPVPANLLPGGDYEELPEPDKANQVAASVGWTAFYASQKLGVRSESRFDSVDVGLLASNLVAAVNPFSSDSDAFFFATQRDTGILKAVGCTSSSGCAEVRSEISGLPRAPIAAYSHTDESGSNAVRFLLVEAAPAGGAQIRRYRLPEPPPAPAPPPPVPVLTGELVGGRIEDVIALDAEVIEDVDARGNVVGQLHVWAAFVQVRRGGPLNVELWTGAYRQCTPTP